MPSTLTLSNGVTLGRDAFIGHYVAAWLAADSQSRYRNNPSTCDLNQPIEDALCCADSAWEQMETIRP